jgi:hypothetical protein
MTKDAKKQLSICLTRETVEWIRATRGWNSINGHIEDLLEHCRKMNVRIDRFCACGCKRPIAAGKAKTATAACRQRLRRKKMSQQSVTEDCDGDCCCAKCRKLPTAHPVWGYDTAKVAGVQCFVCKEPIGQGEYLLDTTLARFGQMFFIHAGCGRAGQSYQKP